MNYWDSRKRVIAMLESLMALAPKAFEHEVITKIEDAFAVIDGDHSDREMGRAVARTGRFGRSAAATTRKSCGQILVGKRALSKDRPSDR